MQENMIVSILQKTAMITRTAPLIAAIKIWDVFTNTTKISALQILLFVTTMLNVLIGKLLKISETNVKKHLVMSSKEFALL
jgi:hypothetical protein